MKVVYEPKAKDHDPSLYVAEKTASFLDGWDAVDERSIQQYREEGYLIIKGGFTPDEVASAQLELSKMTLADDPQCESIYYEGTMRELIASDPVDDKTQPDAKSLEGLALGFSGTNLPGLEPEIRARYVRKFMGFTASHPPLKSQAEHPRLLALVRRLCQETEIDLFQEMAMIKPPGGREKPWHQDHAYFNYPLDTRIVGVWISLGKVTPENGCMFLMPGMHKHGPIPHFMRRDWQICDDDILTQLTAHRVAAPMDGGDVLIFDSKLPHGTPKNNTDEYRWAVQLHYRSARSKPCRDEDRMANFGSEGKDVTC